MLLKRRQANVRHENASYWMSYSDIMAALLLMLILLLFFLVNQYLSLQSTREAELAQKEIQLNEKETLLAETTHQLARKAAELAAAQGQLTNQRVELDDKNIQLEQSLAALALQQSQFDEQSRLLNLTQEEVDEARKKLATQQSQLDDRSNKLSALDAQLLLQQMEVDQLKRLFTSQTEELQQQQAMIDELVGVRARIIASLRDSLTAANLNVNVDRQTGAITLDSAVFFDFGKDTLKQTGRDLLDQFIPVYVRTLMQAENRDYVGELIIEGHTDSTGSYVDNLDLSQRRALAVVKYCLSDSFMGLTHEEKQTLRTIITANGRSWSSPVYTESGSEDAEASRRVEFKFRLKDAEMIDDMNRILSEHGQAPAAQ
ncbi:MAG: OmpA family protein [Clostridia bacterium]